MGKKVKGLDVNRLVEVEIDSQEFKGVFPSRIEEIDGRGVHLAVPMRGGVRIPLHQGEPLRVIYVYDEDVYAFDTRVVARLAEPLAVLVVETPRAVSRIERRKWVRLAVELPLQFQVGPLDGEWARGRTVDLSGGGVLFRTDEDWLGAGTIITLRLGLPERETVTCSARVIEVNNLRRGPLPYEVRCAFQDIREGHRDRIIGYIFACQRELLKKRIRQ